MGSGRWHRAKLQSGCDKASGRYLKLSAFNKSTLIKNIKVYYDYITSGCLQSRRDCGEITIAGILAVFIEIGAGNIYNLHRTNFDTIGRVLRWSKGLYYSMNKEACDVFFR